MTNRSHLPTPSLEIVSGQASSSHRQKHEELASSRRPRLPNDFPDCRPRLAGTEKRVGWFYWENTIGLCQPNDRVQSRCVQGKTPCTKSQMVRYSAMAWIERPPLMSVTQALPWRAAATERLLFLTKEHRIGAIDRIEPPSGNQLYVQNAALFPSPSNTLHPAARHCSAFLSTNNGRVTQGRSGCNNYFSFSFSLNGMARELMSLH